MIQRAVPHGLGRGMAVLCQYLLLQGSGVHPDTDGNPPLPAGIGHRLDPALVPDVARVDADLVHPRRCRFQRQAIVEVDIRYHRDAHRLLEGGDDRHRLPIRHSGTDDIAARGLQPPGLLHTGRNVVGRGVQHGLDGNRRAAAYRHLSHIYGFTHAPFHRQPHFSVAAPRRFTVFQTPARSARRAAPPVYPRRKRGKSIGRAQR